MFHFLVKNTLFNFPKFPGNRFQSRDGKWFSGSRDPGTGNSRLGPLYMSIIFLVLNVNSMSSWSN